MNRTLLALAFTLALVPVANAAGDVITKDVYLHEYSQGFHMVPDSITANVGDTLRLTVRNQGVDHDNGPHDLVVCGDGPTPAVDCGDIWGFTPHIANNQTAVLTAVLKKPGTFTYYCDLPGHAQAGMAGTLTVQGAGATTTSKTSPGVAVLGSLIALAGVAIVRRKARK